MNKQHRSGQHEVLSGSPNKLGATVDADGVNFAVFSEHASAMELCVFSRDGKHEECRIKLPEKTGPIWHGHIPGLPPGTLYGYRAHGRYAPEQGHRFNHNKLLMDPYTRELAGAWSDSKATFGYISDSPEKDLSFDTQDSAAQVPKSVVSDPTLLNKLSERSPWQSEQGLIYEAHAKGLTQLHPHIPAAVRGTYEGLASDAVIEHLQSLGVSAIELLPVHAFLDDSFLIERGLRNYWGYNSIGFFAPEPRYFGPAGLLGFRQMVQTFKAAGIEVILDVVYNHTAEGDHNGPTLCYRGLDNASYYHLIAGQPRYYVNDSGCGNTLNVSHPYVLRMVLDSLRFWVEYMGVDGFRFDLATTLAREHHGFDPEGSFLNALRQDPVLAGVRLIAEPWDLGPGGYQLGGFPHEFSEWNDAYRDTARRYWRGDTHAAQELGARLLASADRFDRSGRRAWSSVNFLSAHDGFTLADVTSFNHRHNEANTEDNRDGHNSNYSDNCGVEGETDDLIVVERRQRRQRNMLATLFLSQGTPMLLAGDEFGNSQNGNNNAYCQDNEIGWVNWDKPDNELLGFVRKLSAFRESEPVLRQSRFLHGDTQPDSELPDVSWTDFSGRELQWRDPGLSCLCLTVRLSADVESVNPINNSAVFVVFNRDSLDADVVLPPRLPDMHWVRYIDTAQADSTEPCEISSDTINVGGASVVALSLQSC